MIRSAPSPALIQIKPPGPPRTGELDGNAVNRLVYSYFRKYLNVKDTIEA
jgi:hypothetical protein